MCSVLLSFFSSALLKSLTNLEYNRLWAFFQFAPEIVSVVTCVFVKLLKSFFDICIILKLYTVVFVQYLGGSQFNTSLLSFPLGKHLVTFVSAKKNIVLTRILSCVFFTHAHSLDKLLRFILEVRFLSFLSRSILLTSYQHRFDTKGRFLSFHACSFTR